MALSALDYFEIQQLYSRFHLSIDLGDTVAYANTFTEDGSFEVLNLPDGAPAAGRTTGRPAIKAMADKLYGGLAGNCRHFVSPTSMIIEGDEHEVRSKGYLYEIRPGTVPNTGVYLTGLYWDRIVKVDGRWQFAERKASMDPQPDAGVPTDVLVVRFDQAHPRA